MDSELLFLKFKILKIHKLMGNREHCLNLYIFFRIKHSYNIKKIYIIAIKKYIFSI